MRALVRAVAHVIDYTLDVLCALTAHARGCRVQNNWLASRLGSWALDVLHGPPQPQPPRVECPTCGEMVDHWDIKGFPGNDPMPVTFAGGKTYRFRYDGTTGAWTEVQP